VTLIARGIAESPAIDTAVTPEREDKIRHRVNRYIDQNLGEPELASANICKEVGVSRSVLYRAFAPLGGVADHIRARRLEATYVLLEDPTVDRGIGAIAREFGFSSNAHFSRLFRQRYGYSPRRARAAGRCLARTCGADGRPRGGGEIFRAWLEQIG
jgi:AraC-like DNA-binding protein